MGNLFAKLFGFKQTASTINTDRPDIPVENQSKNGVIPAELDITRTKEFWDKAVPS